MTSPAADPHHSMRAQLTRAGQLHWFHWLIVALSAALTISAWWFVSAEHEEKIAIRFQEEVDRVHVLLVERMAKYEDGLQAGVAFLVTHGIDTDFETWERYADAVQIQDKYPGINGLGVIYALPREPAALKRFLDRQRAERPSFGIHPAHDQPELLPITYIIPVEGNEKAVGLDMAHEANRYQAAAKARETGTPQITGPIVLVQDAEQTPGFLFYAPFYRAGGPQPPESADARIAAFAGVVYAPFVVRKLIDGALRPEQRLVRIRLLDGDSVLYDEFIDGEGSPLLREEQVLPMHGRSWRLQIQTTPAFATAAHSQQPVFILVLGVVVDGLLLWFFVALSRANRRAVTYADEVVAHLRENESQLARRNEELTQFNYRTSHDLVAPLSTMRGFVSLAVDDIQEGDAEAAVEWLERIDAQCLRLTELTSDLLSLSRAQHDTEDPVAVDLPATVEDIRQGLSQACQELGVTIRDDCALSPPLHAPRRRVLQVLENLISNAVRYASPDREGRWVEVRARRLPGGVEVAVADNGPGIPPELQQRVFEMFFRGPGATAGGSGLGLYIVQQHAEKMGATISLESSPEGSTFTLYIPEEREA